MYPFIYGSDAYGFNPDSIATEGAAYNAMMYNENLYNAGILILNLTESISSSDSQEPYAQLAKVDVITLAESITKILNNDPYFDDIVPLDVVVKFLTSKPMTGEFVSLSELITIALDKQLAPETITLIDSINRLIETAYYDIVFLDDVLTKQITNKGLFDSVRLNDWLSAKLDPASQWSD